jgi:hypothetical protein
MPKMKREPVSYVVGVVELHFVIAHVIFQICCDFIFYFRFMISETEGGPHYLYREPHKGVSLLNWLMIGSGGFFFFSSCNKHLCQSCNELTTG